MVKLMNYSDSLKKFRDETGYKIVLYGAGMYAYAYHKYIPNIDYVCDANADVDSDFDGITLIRPETLVLFEEPLIVVICVKITKVVNQIKKVLQSMDIDAYVFEFGNNIDFNCYRPKLEEKKKTELKYVRIVCYEKAGWILYKFATKMKEELEKRNIRVEIGTQSDPTADINHHIEFIMFEPIAFYTDTMMISHVMNRDTFEQVVELLKGVKMGICMSKETMNKLVEWGAPREKLCYVNPAQDGRIGVRKYVLGITHRHYSDKRKREEALIDICNGISSEFFKLKIMGAGWDKQVEKLRNKGFEVDYYSEFDYDKYIELMQSIDYYLFWGIDEGSMGYLDAIAAGAETLVTPQGFHLDVKDGITYPCVTVKDFIDVLREKQRIKQKRVESVSDWTWGKYAEKHIKIWKYILGSISDEEFYENQHMYEDGEFSVFRYRNVWDEE